MPDVALAKLNDRECQTYPNRKLRGFAKNKESTVFGTLPLNEKVMLLSNDTVCMLYDHVCDASVTCMLKKNRSLWVFFKKL